MINPSLARAVERFADLTQDVPDSDLDREWAWGAYDSEGLRFAFFRTYEELRELAVRTAAERSARGRTASSSQQILHQYHNAYRDLEAALLGAQAGEANRAPGEGEWSLRQIAAHIVEAEVGFFVVVKYALERHRSVDGRPVQISDEVWEAISGLDEASIEEILDGSLAGIRSYYEVLHERVLLEFNDISEGELTVPSMYWEGYEMDLRFRLHRFDSHLRQHIVQVDKTLEGTGHSPNEAKHLLRLIYSALGETEGAAIGAWDVAEEHRLEAAETIAARTDEIAGILT
ncbi:DinB family protein [Chloroflexota bacterium]